jgi:hypothetical protein
MLRRRLNVAQREGWILRSPFAAGGSLISLADEDKRERILTREEEVRLLAACDTPQRAHLKAIPNLRTRYRNAEDSCHSLEMDLTNLSNVGASAENDCLAKFDAAEFDLSSMKPTLVSTSYSPSAWSSIR